ncbi:hypothetical protein [Brevundimonas sp. CEF1]|uniref:hypothetical protein n=1 Tax=Brevundimonas sp. CEF1 TaxID=3442642 RepID=UPI003F514AAE
MTEPSRVAGSKSAILAYVNELKADRDAARAALHAMISGVELVPMTSPADAVKAVAEYENRIATLDKLIAQYEVELAAGRYVD